MTACLHVLPERWRRRGRWPACPPCSGVPRRRTPNRSSPDDDGARRTCSGVDRRDGARHRRGTPRTRRTTEMGLLHKERGWPGQPPASRARAHPARPAPTEVADARSVVAVAGRCPHPSLLGLSIWSNKLRLRCLRSGVGSVHRRVRSSQQLCLVRSCLEQLVAVLAGGLVRARATMAPICSRESAGPASGAVKFCTFCTALRYVASATVHRFVVHVPRALQALGVVRPRRDGASLELLRSCAPPPPGTGHVTS